MCSYPCCCRLCCTAGPVSPQFGPPIVMGSIAGSYINYFVPGWVTKVLVLLVPVTSVENCATDRL